jgi:hypothetical protein
MKKILHITSDNKFISHALTSFENVYPGQNTVWMFANGYDWHASKNHRDLEFTFLDMFKPSLLKKLKLFDLVVIHGFDLFKYPLVALAPKDVKFAWLGWGYDYYGYIYKNEDDLLLTGTQKIQNQCARKTLKDTIYPVKLVKKLVKMALEFLFKKKAIKRIGSFSPVLEEDYQLVEQTKLISFLPAYMPWNYGSLEESLVKNFIGERVSGNSILLGNSASFTNNHLEAFELIKKVASYENTDFKIVAPLSYGDECYRSVILKEGNVRFGDDFKAVTDFISIDEYVALLKQCGFAIMNHKRQQAVGNIVIMMYLGARVFLRADNPTYQMLKKDGAVINTVQELENQPSLLNMSLTEQEIQSNIEILYKHWSKEAIDKKTKDLVEFHLGIQH